MNIREAKEMLNILTECQETLNKALLKAEDISVEGEREELRKFLTTIMADVYVEAIRKIVIQHPNLDPHKHNKLSIVD